MAINQISLDGDGRGKRKDEEKKAEHLLPVSVLGEASKVKELC